MEVTHGIDRFLVDTGTFRSDKKIGVSGIFAVEWTPKDSLGSQAILGSHEEFETEAVALTFFPSWKSLDEDLMEPHLEVIFLVDRSGSMSSGAGRSRISQAQDALRLFLSSLPENCRIQIIGFGSQTDTLFKDGSHDYNANTLKECVAFVDGFSANLGGTDLLLPLQHIFSKKEISSHPRHIFVLTDGQVSNREETIAFVERHRGNSRLSALGVGQGADAELVAGIAAAGFGEADMISDGSMREVVIKQLEKALEPALREPSISFENCHCELVAPSLLPAVRNGDRLNVFGLGFEREESAGRPMAVLRGIAPDGSPFETKTLIQVARHTTVVHKMGAWLRIAELEKLYSEEKLPQYSKEIESLGLKYQLPSSQTSFSMVLKNLEFAKGALKTVEGPTRSWIPAMDVPAVAQQGRRSGRTRKKSPSPTNNRTVSMSSRSSGTSSPSSSPRDRMSLATPPAADADRGMSRQKPPSARPPQKSLSRSPSPTSRGRALPQASGGRRLPSSSAPSGPPSAVSTDIVMRCAALQAASGFWTLKDAGALTGVAMGANAPAGIDGIVWATAVVIAFLETKQAAKIAEWKLFVKKARAYVKKALIAVNSSVDVLEAARKIVLK
jgi:hypothetical protein